MKKEKKKWETPKLICLYRGRAEETVLYSCKGTSQTGPDALGCVRTADPSKKCSPLGAT